MQQGAGSQQGAGAGSQQTTGAGSQQTTGAGSQQTTGAGSQQTTGAGSQQTTASQQLGAASQQAFLPPNSFDRQPASAIGAVSTARPSVSESRKNLFMSILRKGTFEV